MAVGFATLGGGDTVSFDLNTGQIANVQAILNALSPADGSGKLAQVLNNFTSAPTDTTTHTLNVYNLDPANFDPYPWVPPYADVMIADSTNGSAPLSTDGMVGSDRNTLWIGNQGNDTFNIGAPSQTIIAGDGNNSITLNSEFHGGGNDSISVGDGANTISLLGQGVITALDVSGGSGDSISVDGYGTNSDFIQVGNGPDTINVGQDSVDYGTVNQATVIAGTGPDLIDVNASTFLVSVTGGLAADTINAAGMGTIIGSNIDANVSGWGNVEVNVVGGAANNVTVAGGSPTILASGSGNNTFDLNNTYYGTADVTLTGGNNTVNLGLGSANISTAGSESSVIYADGQNTFVNATLGGSDVIHLGNAQNNIDITGSATIFAGTYAGGGLPQNNVVQISGTGNVVFHGGNNDADTVVAGAGNASLYASQGAGAAVGIDSFTGGSGNVLMDASGSAQNEQAFFVGGSGNATMFGGAGYTSFVTGSGDATATGGSGYNYFNSYLNTTTFQAAWDTLTGGGNMSMVGGTGPNYFFAGSGNDTMAADTTHYAGTGSDDNYFTFQQGISGASTITGYSDYNSANPSSTDYAPNLIFSGYGLTPDQIVAGSHVSGGNTIINLGATTITINNFTTLQDWMIHSS